jgi:SagB-type dehydrogenase family enzyme
LKPGKIFPPTHFPENPAMELDTDRWNNLLLPSPDENQLWELFHENSKIGRYSTSLSNAHILKTVRNLYESLPYEGYPIVQLPPPPRDASATLFQVLEGRESTRDFSPNYITPETLSTLLYYSYGIRRNKAPTDFPRSFRMVPSAGALYPLEIYIFSQYFQSAESGLYHYNSPKHHIRLLRNDINSCKISEVLVQPTLASQASVIFFITGIFDRATFKYGNRGYRFALLEAGHVAQNLTLVAGTCGLSSVIIGGFFDQEVDELLDLDGITQSTVSIIAMGQKAE